MYGTYKSNSMCSIAFSIADITVFLLYNPPTGTSLPRQLQSWLLSRPSSTFRITPVGKWGLEFPRFSCSCLHCSSFLPLRYTSSRRLPSAFLRALDKSLWLLIRTGNQVFHLRTRVWGIIKRRARVSHSQPINSGIIIVNSTSISNTNR